MEERNQWNKDPKWDRAIELLKQIAAKTPLTETVKWGGPVFTFDNKNVIGIGGFKNYVGIWFYQGALLKDEKGKLVNANEGVTKALRQWRFGSEEEILENEKLILAYIAEAIENEKAGRGIKPEKKAAIQSDLMDREMQTDPALAAAFAKFSPSKQREFLEHIETAKQEKTKVARLEKAKELILAGKGLNDKYK